jgi:hypothetical protein
MATHVSSAQAPGEAVRIARAIIAGRTGVLEGCIPLASIAHEVVPDWRVDRDFVIFGGVASEIDALPFGPVRERWSSAALAKADIEIARYTLVVQERVLGACRNIVERFDSQRPAGAV